MQRYKQDESDYPTKAYRLYLDKEMMKRVEVFGDASGLGFSKATQKIIKRGLAATFVDYEE